MKGLPAGLSDLLRPAAYSHKSSAIELVETHISWIVLTGELAYKIKKPVRLPFVDYRTLASRKSGCEAELKLNRRFAPALYLDVVAVTDNGGKLQVGGNGRVVEYAVCMRQFSREAQLDRLLDEGGIGAGLVEQLGRRLAELHRNANRADATDPDVQPDTVIAQMRDNFIALRGRLDPENDELLGALARWTDTVADSLAERLRDRLADGRVREAHGDLHAGNLVVLNGELTAFDCIEFDRAYRVIDVMSDIGFLFMDLAFRNRDDLGYVLMTAYLEQSGDYDGVAVLRAFACYRALVRAKIAVLRGDRQTAGRYVGCAYRIALPQGRPTTLLMHGLSGSGKTFVSQRLIAALPALRVRSDLERKRLAGLEAGQRSESGIGTDLYDPQSNARTYAWLSDIVMIAGAARFDLIVDAAFLSSSRRRDISDAAAESGAVSIIVDCVADRDRIVARLGQRAGEGSDASEADVKVLDYQRRTAESLTADERARTVEVLTTVDFHPAQLAQRIRVIAGELRK